jgi:hypothetical protein
VVPAPIPGPARVAPERPALSALWRIDQLATDLLRVRDIARAAASVAPESRPAPASGETRSAVVRRPILVRGPAPDLDRAGAPAPLAAPPTVATRTSAATEPAIPPLEAADVAGLVNDALLEQAQLHGVDLS